MKRRLIIQICCLALILSFSMANAAEPNSESRLENAGKTQVKVKMDNPGRTADYDQDREANKSERFQLLEWLIIQKLQKQYQQMEAPAGFEDVLE